MAFVEVYYSMDSDEWNIYPPGEDPLTEEEPSLRVKLLGYTLALIVLFVLFAVLFLAAEAAVNAIADVFVEFL